MLPLFLILYGEDDDTYGGSQYGAGSTSDRYGEDRYSITIFEYGDGGLGSYVDSLLDSNEYGGDESVYGGQDPYDDGGGSYGGFLNLSIPYLGSYKPKYGL